MSKQDLYHTEDLPLKHQEPSTQCLMTLKLQSPELQRTCISKDASTRNEMNKFNKLKDDVCIGHPSIQSF